MTSPMESLGAAHNAALRSSSTDYRVLARAFSQTPSPKRPTDPIPKAAPKTKTKGRGLPARSVKRVAEGPVREAFRAAVLADCGYRCVGPDRGLPEQCGVIDVDRPPLEVHEPDQRSTHPGSHVRSTLAVALCQVHHDMVSSPVGEMRVLVESIGLIVRATT